MAADRRGRSLTDSAPIGVGQLRLVLAELGATLTEMEGGTSRVFRIALGDGTPLILKTYDDRLGTNPAREAYAAGLLVGLGINVTRFLFIDESRTKLPVPFAIMNYLPGVSAAELAADPGISDVYRQMGELLRLLHTIKLPAYGAFGRDGIVDPVSSHLDFVTAAIDRMLPIFKSGTTDRSFADRVERRLRADLEVARHSAGPVFAHQDIQPRNVLVERTPSGRLQITGLIDFGIACAADPISDLARSQVLCDDECPVASAPSLDAYGPIQHPQPERAWRFYRLYNCVRLFAWIAGNHPPDDSRYQSAFRAVSAALAD